MKTRRHLESGQTLVWIALALLVMMGAAALAVDGGNLLWERRRMQNVADAAALAGAQEMCNGKPNDVAIATANDYATSRPPALWRAAWATPVPSTTTVGGKTQRAMEVTAGKTSNSLLAVVFGSSSTDVVAFARARCEKTSTACGNAPITLDVIKFAAMGCNDPFIISLDQNPPVPATGCDWSHVFTGVASTPEVGWIEGCGNKFGDPDCNDVPYEAGTCVDAKPGSAVGIVGGGGQELKDWINNGNQPVRFPLFECYNCSPCTSASGKAYKLAGFGCFKLNPNPNGVWIHNNYNIPALPGKTCSQKVDKVVVVTKECNCSVSCGSGGGLPGPYDDTIPVLF